MKKHIRPIAICIFYHQGKVLVSQGYDRSSKQKFFRPLGGGIELGETSQQALIREIKEELNTKVTALRQIGIFENIFTYQGQPGHEIVFVYDGQFVDPKFYLKKKLVVLEEGTNSSAVWVKTKDLAKKNVLLYPLGLKELINAEILNV